MKSYLYGLAIYLVVFLDLNLQAAPAVFSNDGTTVWTFSSTSDSLISVTLDGTSSPAIPLPKELMGGEPPAGICRGREGFLIAANQAIWLWNPALTGSSPKKIAAIPPEFTVRGLSSAEDGTLNGMILINGRHHFSSDAPIPRGISSSATLYGLAAGQEAFNRILTRSVNEVTASPAFYMGRIIFGGDNDLWEGKIDQQEKGQDLAGVLWGRRMVPLAILKTGIGNGEGMGVRTVVIADNKAWCLLTGHRARSAVVVLPLGSPQAVDEEHDDLQESWKTVAHTLSAARICQLPEAERQNIDALCSWTGDDGKWKVAFRTDGNVFWFFQNGNDLPQKVSKP